MIPVSRAVFQWRMRHAFGYQKRKPQSEPEDALGEVESAATSESAPAQSGLVASGPQLPPISSMLQRLDDFYGEQAGNDGIPRPD
jgi:hypothetical protein